MKRTIFASILGLAIVIAGAGMLVRMQMNRGFQINTAIRMQAICRSISEQTQSMDARAAAARARQIVASHYRGMDAWQRPFVFLAREDGPRMSYLLVSLGSDAKADRPLHEYFAEPRSDIRGQAQRDIVFRDGDWVTNALK